MILGGVAEDLGGCGEYFGGYGEYLGGCGEYLGGCGEDLGGCGEDLGGCGEDLGSYGEDLGRTAHFNISTLGRRCERKNRLCPYWAREWIGAEGGSLPPFIGLCW